MGSSSSELKLPKSPAEFLRPCTSDLVPEDTNNRLDIFVHDRQTDRTIRANVSSSDEQANHDGLNCFLPSGNSGCHFPYVSGDGRFVVFHSDATNLVPGDTNNRTDVFLRDLVGGAVPSQDWNWTQVFPSDSPSPRARHSTAFHAGDREIVLFGGIVGEADGTLTKIYDDTWAWIGDTWSELSIGGLSPPGLFGMAATYDPLRQEALFYGGDQSLGPGAQLSDSTWVWRENSWEARSPASSPPPLLAASAVFDGRLGKILLFGGFDSAFTFSGESWLWNGSTWENATPISSPSPRATSSMVYDPHRQEIVLFGGSDFIEVNGTPNGGWFADTWIWKDGNWNQQFPLDSPSPREGHSMSYEPSSGQTVLFGGFDGASTLKDTWLWNGNNWTEVTSQTAPPARALHTMAYDHVSQEIVLFGGGEATAGRLVFYSDTWKLSYSGAGQCQAVSITAHPVSKVVSNGQSSLLRVSALGSEPISYQWYRGTSGDSSSPAGTNSATFTTPPLTSPTDYWVRVSNACSSVDSNTATITVQSSANFSWSPNTPLVGERIQFTDLSTGNPSAWIWNFGDGFASNMQNPSHPYSTSGIKTVSLTTSTSSGFKSISKQLTVQSQPADGIDLTADVESITPSGVLAGSSIEITYRVTNVGDQTAAIGTGLGLWLSENSTLDASDQSLPPLIAVGTLSGQASVSATEIRTVPAGTAPGTWYIIAKADAADAIPGELREDNNTGSLVFTVQSPLTCSLTCAASVPSAGIVNAPVAFSGSANPSNCSEPVTFRWNFGDGPLEASGQDISHSYSAAGTYQWNMVARADSVACLKSGTVSIAPPTGPALCFGTWSSNFFTAFGTDVEVSGGQEEGLDFVVPTALTSGINLDRLFGKPLSFERDNLWKREVRKKRYETILLNVTTLADHRPQETRAFHQLYLETAPDAVKETQFFAAMQAYLQLGVNLDSRTSDLLSTFRPLVEGEELVNQLANLPIVAPAPGALKLLEGVPAELYTPDRWPAIRAWLNSAHNVAEVIQAAGAISGIRQDLRDIATTTLIGVALANDAALARFLELKKAFAEEDRIWGDPAFREAIISVEGFLRASSTTQGFHILWRELKDNAFDLLSNSLTLAKVFAGKAALSGLSSLAASKGVIISLHAAGYWAIGLYALEKEFLLILEISEQVEQSELSVVAATVGAALCSQTSNSCNLRIPSVYSFLQSARYMVQVWSILDWSPIDPYIEDREIWESLQTELETDLDLERANQSCQPPSAVDFIVDIDADGVSGFLEETAPGGDGNGDGIQDSEQANVASLPNTLSDSPLTIASPSGTSIVDVSNQASLAGLSIQTSGSYMSQASLIDSQAIEGLPGNIGLPVGILEFAVQGVPSGGTTSVDLILHSGVEIDTFYGYGGTPGDTSNHWYEFLFDGSTGAQLGGNRITLRFRDGQRGDDDLSADGRIVVRGAPAVLLAKPIFFPQIGGGGGLSTTFTVLNPTEKVATAALRFYNDDGSPRDFNLRGIPESAAFFELASGDSRRLTAFDDSPNVTAGWAILESNTNIAGVINFDLRDGAGVLQSRVAVLGTEKASKYAIPVQVNTAARLDTGVAIANVGSDPVTVTLRLMDSDGIERAVLVPLKMDPLPPQGHVAAFVTELFSDQLEIGNFQGKLVIEARKSVGISQGPGEISATGLVLKEGLLAAVPVVRIQ